MGRRSNDKALKVQNCSAEFASLGVELAERHKPLYLLLVRELQMEKNISLFRHLFKEFKKADNYMKIL
jgi:hypothetical protein